MHKLTSASLISILFLTGCSSIGQSRANPFNWFGGDEDIAPATVSTEEVNPLIPESTGIFAASRAERQRYKGTPIAAVTDLTVERVPGGLLIRATGLANRQGIYDARLTPDNDDEAPVDGVLTYRLEGRSSSSNTAQGAPQTREVIVARRLTNQELGNTQTIRVKGVQNELQVRRR